VDDNVSGVQRIHKLDLETIRIFLYYIIDLHPSHGTGAAHEPTVADIRQKRPKPLMHGLIAIAQRIQDVAYRGHVEMFFDETEDFFI